MKITHKTAAQSLLLLAACLPAAAQIALNPGQYPNESSPVVSVPYHEDKVRTLQGQLEGYERQLRQKSAMVENAREEAISAGIQGDGAGSYIDVYRQQQKELELLQAALTPQIDQTRKLIAGLTNPGSPAASSLSRSRTPASLSRKSTGTKQSKRTLIAGQTNLTAAGR